MKTWKTKRRVCRVKKSGKFTFAGLCKAFRSSLVRRTPKSKRGQYELF